MFPALQHWSFAKKERKAHVDNSLRRFFLAILAFFCGNSFSFVAGCPAPFLSANSSAKALTTADAPFRGQSIQVTVPEQFMHKTERSNSCPVKLCQTQSNHFSALTMTGPSTLATQPNPKRKSCARISHMGADEKLFFPHPRYPRNPRFILWFRLWRALFHCWPRLPGVLSPG
jgi:hypothetical protein